MADLSFMWVVPAEPHTFTCECISCVYKDVTHFARVNNAHRPVGHLRIAERLGIKDPSGVLGALKRMPDTYRYEGLDSESPGEVFVCHPASLVS